ncbi:hypothetical protein BDK51DRAFT_45653 [Blyttiomyces helicus]|uniref:6-phosphogluconate dehydrogenase NADP-binding domain-containing protein n=1 Tax=Blyttiomyces helicus TaxID=388810 RepID=A0A4P9WJZ0_9FUNG|nr:hypothetical protein BDK51DRAFT_45653 [Blyttiomyces helicus]|eukprot:RKO91460.1 hypothetical protein BDK51DRAFT_45653 [Blyttiomyces helicus]
MTQTGFIGLGSMGAGMAANLSKSITAADGLPLKVWNRTMEKCQPIVELGAVAEPGGPAALAKTCDIIFAMPFNDAAVRQVLSGITAAPAKQNLIFVSCPTVSPQTTRDLAATCRNAEIRFVACNVFGRPDIAALGKLGTFSNGKNARSFWPSLIQYALRSVTTPRTVAVLAGAPEVKQAVKPYVQGFTRAIMDLVGNFLIVASIELLAEAQTLAEKSGLTRSNVTDFVDNVMPTHILQQYSAIMASREFEITPEKTEFAVSGGLKDAALFQSLANSTNTPLPVCDILTENLSRQKELGGGNQEWSSLAESVREKAHL